MSVGVEIPRVSFVGNGSTTVFPLGFTYTDAPDVEVYLDDVIQVTGFTVSESDVTFDSAPAAGVKVTLLRNTPLDQPIPFEDPQKTTLAEVERLGDRGVRQLQESEDKFARVPLMPVSSTPESLAGSTIGYDSQGNPIARSADQEVEHLGITEQVDAAAASAAAAAASEANTQANRDAVEIYAAQVADPQNLLQLRIGGYLELRTA